MQIEVSSGKFLEHATLAQQAAAAQEAEARSLLTHEQVMSHLAELDKFGQEGAAPIDDAEVCTTAFPLVKGIECCWSHQARPTLPVS